MNKVFILLFASLLIICGAVTQENAEALAPTTSDTTTTTDIAKITVQVAVSSTTTETDALSVLLAAWNALIRTPAPSATLATSSTKNKTVSAAEFMAVQPALRHSNALPVMSASSSPTKLDVINAIHSAK
eukprot:CAMPEP_0176432752 /NCGR_PEP_ID=MMETSP0127-20121128/15573_1 /TAXON_ID=938130 /ORGANISM="Platyophrya macrostoma, Strain WH" /LENGTH=129 /DNA_ID=CAMNT_0017814967 /DNA_START=39 /DNA_END=426 /DNA_ORIENTATION=+